MYDKFTLVAYGCGKSFYSYIERLDKLLKIDCFSDKNSLIHGKKLYGDDRKCLAPEEIKRLKNPFVILTVDDISVISEVCAYLDQIEIPYRHAKEILQLKSKDMADVISPVLWPVRIQRNRIHRFIDVNLVGTTSCNFRCEYCYVWRKLGFHGESKLSDHSVRELCEGLSAEKTGGICFINMCARGETLLADGIVELTEGLLQEGHYVSIVTNGTVTKRINEILKLPKILLQRMFFKISFHYKELKNRSLLDVFWANIENIKKSECSFTLEVTPGDGTEGLIREIKEICVEKMEGLLPHVSFTRDSKKIGYDLLSEHSIETYREIWGQFHSEMFDLKSNWYGKNMRKYNCYAGSWSYLVNAVTGDIKACYQREPIGNIFSKEQKGFPIEAVRKTCSIAYCFNNHAFLAWGCVPEIKCSDYLHMRDRISQNGRHWVKEPVYSFMAQKLKENNFEYIDRWPDYEKLYAKGRNKAIVLFNSPDYNNLGDHAIALAERKFSFEYFKDYDFIEISCSQYIKENLRIKSVIKEDDLLLITGGGNMGDYYLRIQDIISHIIQTYQDNPIIVAPQSIYFEGGDFSQIERTKIKTIYEGHKKLLLAAREDRTYHLYEEIFGDSVKKVRAPDMAFFLTYSPMGSVKREGAMVCLREDKERLGLTDKDTIIDFFQKRNVAVAEYCTISSSEILLNNREEKIMEMFNKIANAEVVITDRLHCMIFCIITDTPCIVFDNVTGKIFDVLKRLPLCEKVVKCQSVNEVEDAISKVLTVKRNNTEVLKIIREELSCFSEKIRNFIG